MFRYTKLELGTVKVTLTKEISTGNVEGCRLACVVAQYTHTQSVWAPLLTDRRTSGPGLARPYLGGEGTLSNSKFVENRSIRFWPEGNGEKLSQDKQCRSIFVWILFGRTTQTFVCASARVNVLRTATPLLDL